VVLERVTEFAEALGRVGAVDMLRLRPDAREGGGSRYGNVSEVGDCGLVGGDRSPGNEVNLGRMYDSVEG